MKTLRLDGRLYVFTGVPGANGTVERFDANFNFGFTGTGITSYGGFAGDGNEREAAGGRRESA